MNTTDNLASTPTETLSFDFELSHSPEKIWSALTDPTLLAEWLLPVVGFGLKAGTSFTFTAPSQPGWDGLVHCRILESEAPKKLSYAWVVGDMDTTVTFTLTPTAAGTRLSLVHAGFQPHQKHNAAGARYGWRMMTEKLSTLLSRV